MTSIGIFIIFSEHCIDGLPIIPLLFPPLLFLFILDVPNTAAIGIAIILETKLVPKFSDDFLITDLLNRLLLPLYPIHQLY